MGLVNGKERMNPGKEFGRTVQVRAATTAGWVQGGLHVPGRMGLLEFLNNDEAYLRFTDVTLPGKPGPLPFMALRRDAVELLVPERSGAVSVVHDNVEVRSHDVWLWMAGRTVKGHVRVPAHIRVSDHAMHWKDFLPVWAAEEQAHNSPPVRMPVVLIHVPHVLAFVEPTAPDAGAEVFSRSL